MANTRASYQDDQECLEALVTHTLTSFEEDGVTTLGNGVLQRQSQLTSVKFPNLTNTGSNTFQYCTGLTTIGSDAFPNLGTIGSSAFANCTGLTNVTFPSVTSVASSAFSSCTNLETFTTGTNTVAFNSPFPSCSKLNALIINSTAMSTLDSATGLSGTAIANYNGAVYVPDAMVATYRANDNWKNYFVYSQNDYPVTEFSYIGYYETISDTWAEIIANNNYAADYSIGDMKAVNLGATYGDQLMELVALDTDIRADGDTSKNNGKARMTWISKDLITTHNMNSSNVTTDGWVGTAMRSWLRSDILPLLPSVIQSNIVEVSKTYNDYNDSATETANDTVWIPSYREIFGGTNYETSGVIYSTRFTSAANRIKYLNHSASYWWLRSANSATNFRYVNNNGNDNNNNASTTNGVALGSSNRVDNRSKLDGAEGGDNLLAMWYSGK